VNTVLSVKKEQWMHCWASCGEGDNPESAGIDWWSGEQTCLCKYEVQGYKTFKRLRLEPQERIKSWDYEGLGFEYED
jgi:hypothetical protein